MFREDSPYLFASLPSVISSLAYKLGFPSGAVVKNSPANVGDARDAGSIFVSKRSPGEGNGTHSSIFEWRIPRTEELGGLQSMGSQKSHWDTTEHCTGLQVRSKAIYPTYSLLSTLAWIYYFIVMVIMTLLFQQTFAKANNLCFKGTFWNIHQLFYRNQSSIDCLCPRILWSTWIKDLCLAVSSNPKQYHQDPCPT